MVEKREIELIPKEIEAAKTREGLVRRIRLIGILFFLVSLLVFGGLFAFSWTLSTQLNNLKQDSAVEVAQMVQFADTEAKVLGLTEKSGALSQILAQRDHFSIALGAIETSRPSGLKVTGLNVEKDKSVATINGETSSYVTLATFLQNLVDSQKGGKLFTKAVLDSVNLNNAKGTAEFVIEATMTNNGLKTQEGAQ